MYINRGVNKQGIIEDCIRLSLYRHRVDTCLVPVVTAPPRRRGPGPQPVVSFKYNLRLSVRSYLHSLAAGDNLVSDG
jgi:hypothetical protein